MPVSDYSRRDSWTLSPVAKAKAQVESNSRLFAGLGTANVSPGFCDVKRCQERQTAGPSELMVLITPDPGALFVWLWFTEP